jgi:hypothetical protein
MKKIKIVLTAIVMLFAVTTFATPSEKVSPHLKAAFKSDFSKASAATWEKSGDFYFATFQINNMSVTAAYNEDGELIGWSKEILAEQLPQSVSSAIEGKYKGLNVDKTVTELTYDGLTKYYVTVKDSSRVINLRCYSNGYIDEESKTSK